MLPLLLIIVLAGLILLFIWDRKKPANYPPGPWGLPLLGHLHLLGDHPQKTLVELGKKYGPVMACDFGSFPGVVLNDYKLIKEAFHIPSFQGRPKLRPVIERSGGIIKGIIFTEGQEWSEQRRFALRHLRDFGFGKGSQESLIKEEVEEVIQRLKEQGGDPVSTQQIFNAAIINALWTMIAGIRHSQTDPKLIEILNMTTDSMADPSPAALFMPWLTKLAPGLSGWTSFMRDIEPSLKFLQTFVDEHKNTYVQDSPRDFIDAYLDEINKTTDHASSFYRGYGESSLVVTILDLFFAASETTTHTLSWSILFLSLNKNVQLKAQEEIDSIVNRSRFPCLSDREKLPYMEATIMETLRFSSIIPLGVWHSTVKTVEFNGYTIPSDTMIVPNLYYVHHDPRIWGDPENFRPERFLSEDGKRIVKPEEFIPFSTGKRLCIGNNLALDEIFLFLSTILQQFSFDIDPSSPTPSTEPVFGPVSAPKKFMAIFKQR